MLISIVVVCKKKSTRNFWEWIRGWAQEFSPRRTLSSQRKTKEKLRVLREAYSQSTVRSVVNSLGKPTQLATLIFGGMIKKPEVLRH